MWWSVFWLSLGFLLRTLNEWCDKTKARLQPTCQSIKSTLEEWRAQMFDLMLLASSFALVYTCFMIMHVSTWQALLIFLFWSFIVVLIKVE
jgi:hypothetical protein